MDDSHHFVVLVNVIRHARALPPINLPLARPPSPRSPLHLLSVPSAGNLNPSVAAWCVKGLGSARAARYRCKKSVRERVHLRSSTEWRSAGGARKDSAASALAKLEKRAAEQGYRVAGLMRGRGGSR